MVLVPRFSSASAVTTVNGDGVSVVVRRRIVPVTTMVPPSAATSASSVASVAGFGTSMESVGAGVAVVYGGGGGASCAKAGAERPMPNSAKACSAVLARKMLLFIIVSTFGADAPI